MNNTKKTAASEYSQRAAVAQDLLKRIAARLSDHHARQAAEPCDWGYVGDLGRVNEELAQCSPPSGTAAASTNWALRTKLLPSSTQPPARFHLIVHGKRAMNGGAKGATGMDDKSANTKWAAIKTGSGRITGYIEVFRTTGDKWVTIPGASRFADASARESHPYSEIANGSAA